jgi:DNA-binding transcriptional ArsR family regulator
MDAIKRMAYWLLEGTKGGPTRIRLLAILEKKPMNMHKLSQTAEMDYKSIEHHISLLEKNGLIGCMGNGYGKMYFVSDELLAQKEIMAKIRGEKNAKGTKKGKK